MSVSFNKLPNILLVILFIALISDMQASAKTYYSKQQTIPLQNKADSCIIAKDWKQALDLYMEIIDHTKSPERRIIQNAAELSSKLGNIDYSMQLLWRLVSSNPNWYLPAPLDDNFMPLKSHPDWTRLNDTITSRRNHIEKDYDHALIARLKRIRKADQNVRHEYLQAIKAIPADSTKIDSLVRRMTYNDSINLIEVKDILTTYGWPPRNIVGNNASTLWLVIQHADTDTQKQVLPILKEAVKSKAIKASQIAMLQDRILVNLGNKQIYGTQLYQDDNGKYQFYPIEDEENVNARRSEVGLETIEDYYLRISTFY